MGEHKNSNKGGKGKGKFTLHVVDGFSIEQRDEHAHRANEAMDALIASGADSNAWLREQFTKEIVFGVWQDNREPGGIGVAILKGKGRVMLVAQGSRSHSLTTSDIRCKCIEEAEAMCQVFGDGRKQAA